MSLETLRKEVNFGLDNLERVYLNICDFSQQEIDERIKLSALTYECLGYYNAVEHLIIRILKYVRITIPSGSSSHKDTLKAFDNFIRTNNVCVNEETIKIIQNLMAFRHVATKIYGFLVDQGKLQAVIDDIQRNHNHIQQLVLNTIQVVSSEKP